MRTIKPSKAYYLDEILEDGLIPGVTGYAALYNLVTKRSSRKTNDGKLKYKRSLRTETNSKGMRALHDGKPWNKIKGKIKVKGSDIIAFLRINNML